MIHVVLVEPEIHWNTGNVGRTCLAAGAALHLVAPLGFSLDERAVRRAGLDYWERVSPRVWTHFEALEEALPTLGTPYFVSPDGERSLWDVRFPPEVALVFGKESVGFRPEVRARHRERLVHIPMAPGSVRSLNLSTSVAVILYEVLRQRRSG